MSVIDPCAAFAALASRSATWTALSREAEGVEGRGDEFRGLSVGDLSRRCQLKNATSAAERILDTQSRLGECREGFSGISCSDARKGDVLPELNSSVARLLQLLRSRAARLCKNIEGGFELRRREDRLRERGHSSGTNEEGTARGQRGSTHAEKRQTSGSRTSREQLLLRRESRLTLDLLCLCGDELLSRPDLALHSSELLDLRLAQIQLRSREQICDALVGGPESCSCFLNRRRRRKRLDFDRDCLVVSVLSLCNRRSGGSVLKLLLRELPFTGNTRLGGCQSLD